jgi:hypothetical protein
MPLLGGLTGYADPRIEDKPVKKLAAAKDSLAYLVAQVAAALDAPNQSWGGSGGDNCLMSRKSLVPFDITAGDEIWGDEYEINNGSVIEGGNPNRRFVFTALKLFYIAETNRPMILEFYSYQVGEPVACEFIVDKNIVRKDGHGLVDQDKIVLPVIDTTTGILTHAVYFVVQAEEEFFRLSRSLNGDVVVMTGVDGKGSYAYIGHCGDDGSGVADTQTLATESLIYSNSNEIDCRQIDIRKAPEQCNLHTSIRATSNGGGNRAQFWITLHVYDG